VKPLIIEFFPSTSYLLFRFYGCETWSLALKEEHRLRVFENRVLRRIFWAEREEVAGGWWRLHNEELHNLYGSPILLRWSNQGGWDGQGM